MFVSPPNSHIGILTLSVMVLKGGAFEKWLGHEGGALMHEISALIKDTRGAFLPCENATKSLTWKCALTWHRYPVSKTVGNKCVDHKLLSSLYFARVAQTD